MLSVGKLMVTLPSDCEIAMTRIFDAPRPMVFDCWTKPQLLQRWLLGPPGWTMPVCEIDLKVGGRYRYVWRNDSEDREFGSTGLYQVIAAPELIVCTEFMDGTPPEDGGSVNTLTLSESAGRTTAVNTMRLTSKAVRDRVLATGMAKGVEASYEMLEALLAESIS
jgi:uncharacterized protein YndB with AHSA1/START domain